MTFITGHGAPIASARAHRRLRGRRAGGRRRGGSGSGSTVQGLPLSSRRTAASRAIDLNKGEIVWQVAHGETPDNVRNHPALKG